MVLQNKIEIDNNAIKNNFERLIDQTFKLLPNREEGVDWQKPLETIIVEITGMNHLFIGQQEKFLTLLSKLEGMSELTDEKDFLVFRRMLFECLNLLTDLEQSCLA